MQIVNLLKMQLSEGKNLLIHLDNVGEYDLKMNEVDKKIEKNSENVLHACFINETI